MNWYHLGCGNISESERAEIAETHYGIELLAKSNRNQIGLRMLLKFSKVEAFSFSKNCHMWVVPKTKSLRERTFRDESIRTEKQ